MNSSAARDLESSEHEIAIRLTMVCPILSATMAEQNATPIDCSPTGELAFLALVSLWAVIYMSGLSRPALLDDADTVHAEAAKEMLQRHDWVRCT